MSTSRPPHHKEPGLAAPQALVFLLLLATVIVVVNFGHQLMVRWQIQEAADAAALSGARALAYGLTLNFPLAISTAKATVRQDAAAPLLADAASKGWILKVQVGYWDLSWTKNSAPANLNGWADPAHYVPSVNEVPAVKVSLAKTGSATKPETSLSAYFASVTGFGHAEAAALAVAVRPGGIGHVYGAGVNDIKLVE